ncbi:MAG: HAD family hydrolase [Nodosilinea sp.]
MAAFPGLGEDKIGAPLPSYPMMTPQTLALDFDGVVCDGLLEYFATAWRAYGEIFGPPEGPPPPQLADHFYPLRPVVESGWEMPLLIHGLQRGLADQDLLDHWPTLVPQLLTETDLNPAQLGAAVDGVRDRWIQTDLTDWLSLHRFYPGVLPRLTAAAAAGVEVVIISTKEGRFIQQLLGQQGMDLGPNQIFGKEIKQPKYETLRQLRRQGRSSIWFVEDRLPALTAVQQQSDLQEVQLFLAEWGYNTVADRHQACQTRGVQSLKLEQFIAPFSAWTGSRHG